MNVDSFVRLVSYPTQRVMAGTWLLRRNVRPESVIFVGFGRVALGLAGAADLDAGLEHRMGVLEGPGWLDAGAAVLNLPSVVDALAETEVVFHHVPLAEFQACVHVESRGLPSVMVDLAKAYRQQTDLLVSRFAKCAESRCAEWLLNQVSDVEENVCCIDLKQQKRFIAAQLSIAPETFSRVLRQLRERRLISGSGRMVNLLDIPALRSLAEI